MASKNGKQELKLPAVTFCRKCNAGFPAAIPIVGGNPHQEHVEMMGKLAEHIIKAHPEQVQPDMAAQMEVSLAFSAQCVLAHFKTGDGALIQWAEHIRKIARWKLAHGGISDEKIRNQVEDLFQVAEEMARNPTREETIALLTSMRDAIEEREPEISQPV